MASMNNWLGFSLSPQEFPSQPQENPDFNSEECFDLTSHHSSLPSLNLPPPFDILEAFNQTNQSQDWNMKEVNMNYKANSEIYHNSLENQQPKLENFLGNSFTDQHHHHHHKVVHHQGDYIYSNGGGGENSTIGISMIKNWLRNNPNTPPENNKTEIEGTNMVGANNGQNLSLSMSTGSQSTSASTALPLLTATAAAASSDGGESYTSETKQAVSNGSQSGAIETVPPRKAIDTFGQRTSIYRGVTRHRWTGRYEAHLWDNSCRREGQTRKGRQVYLGGYDKEEKAARSYDLAALKYWGTTTTTNFPMSNYEKELEEMQHMTRQEYVASLRRKSTGFSRGASIYRGVTRHHQHGRWQARIGRVAGNKDLYLGTFSTQEEAAEAYDIAAIKFRGLNAVTNFEMSRYDVKSILESSTLPIGTAAKRLKDAENAAEMANDHDHNAVLTSHLAEGLTSFAAWPSPAFQQAQPLSIHYPYNQQRLWCKQEQDSENFQDYHQMTGNTHNFLQPNSVLHNLMSLDSSSIEQNQGQFGYGSNPGGGGYVLPMGSTIIADHDQNMFVSSDPYNQTRNLYYNSQESVNGTVKIAAVYDNQVSNCNNWVPTAVPTIAAARPNSVAVCHGASTFTVWNDK